ncbi:SNF2-related protein [uncultured Draconibacterium sp.]|uniref:SNF2-related protein n=1 Tax=uncultured Draconibacterium sp. TaxID=1573823 RepID=UPI003260E70F
MIKLNYSDKYLSLHLESINGNRLIFEDWLNQLSNPTIYNVLNDLMVNGSASLNEDKEVIILYEDLSQLDEFERSSLTLPKPYPFDIFIDLVGSGLKDLNLKLKYSFQDFAHGNGSGNILFRQEQRNGAYLNNDTEYLLSSQQFLLIEEIDRFNTITFNNSNELLKSISKIQELAANANAVLSKILVDTTIVAPDKVKIELEEIAKDKYRLKPTIENIDNDKFQKSFGIFPRVKSEYSFKEDNKKVRVVIDNEEDESGNSIQSELGKLKRKHTFSSTEINEMYNAPTKFWDTDIFDLNEFGERVLELGVYKPKFYPFISPYKSQWIPGIVIEDKKEGSRLLTIKNNIELAELKELVNQSKARGENSVTFKNEELDLAYIPSIIENAEKQLSSPNKPITNPDKENEKPENETKVLIIKENTEQAEYTESEKVIADIQYNFQSINNLSSKIKLKDHQRDGIAWLQTLSKPPYSLPGVLLADDMGLGKTLQVLYFVEWYTQNINKKPILVVAPVSLLENWQNEYQKFFPNAYLKTVTLWGSNVRNYILPNDKPQTIKNLSGQSIFLTTYETLRKQQIPLGLINWGVIILDEAQKIKTPGTFVTNAAKALKSEFKIAMTGTPVENTLMDLWCIVDFCSPGLLENAKLFASKFQKPLKDENTDYKELSETLRGKIGDTLLRRMKTDVAKDLPNIEYLKHKEVMPPEQFNLYMNELSEIERLKGDSENRNPVLQGIFNLRSISDHPYLKHYQIENIKTDELIKTSAKLKKVVAILDNIKNQNEKAILFTENKSMQRVLRRIIAEHFEINSSIINGETPTSKSKNNKTKLSRQQEIDKYQEKDGFNVIIMSPVAAGFGLNITEANHVIHYTRHWNPAKEQQATDRAYRIGQKKPVKVYYPLAVSPDNEMKTFDIILDELLSRKSHLATSTLFPTEQIEIGKDDFINSINAPNSEEKIIELDKIESLDKLQPLVFEAAIALLLEKAHGGNTWLTPKSNDKGADIIHFKDGENTLIQIKQSSSRLGIESGQEISYALPEYNKKYECIFKPQVITNNYFNQSAIELAKQHDVELVNRESVNSWIVEHPLKFDDIDRKLRQRVEN